jgi:hypothetical protein
MKAKRVIENINFERGQDPTSSLRIGRKSKLFNIPEGFYSWIDVGREIRDNIGLLTNNEYNNKKLPKLYFNKIQEKWFLKDQNLKEDLRNWIIKYRPRVGDMGAHNSISLASDNWGKNIKESISFERNQSPKSSMNIGYGKYSEDVKRLNDLLSKKGFEIGSITNPDNSKGIEDIAQWNRGSDYLVFFTFTNKLGEFYKKVYFDINQSHRETGMKEFITSWKKEYNIDESHNFERGKDINKSIGVGVDRILKAGEEIEIYLQGFEMYRPEIKEGRYKAIVIKDEDINYDPSFRMAKVNIPELDGFNNMNAHLSELRFSGNSKGSDDWYEKIWTVG